MKYSATEPNLYYETDVSKHATLDADNKWKAKEDIPCMMDAALHTTNISFQKGLMELRSTPKEHGCSPAQLVFGHSLRTRISISQSALIKGSPSNFSAARKEKKERENYRYNESAHVLLSSVKNKYGTVHMTFNIMRTN